MLYKTPMRVEIYEMQMTNIESDSNINTDISKFSKSNLISIPNPCYKDVI